jgi:hypothetical protein
MNIFLGDSNAKVGRGDIFKQTIGNESLHETSNDNMIGVVNFATPKNLVVKRISFHTANFITSLGLLLMERHTIRLIMSW